jgi:penicillin V acylase-like amidase (Ntn superfamily)
MEVLLSINMEKEFPNGGMNEKGLVVEMMWLDGTSFPTPTTVHR